MPIGIRVATMNVSVRFERLFVSDIRSHRRSSLGLWLYAATVPLHGMPGYMPEVGPAISWLPIPGSDQRRKNTQVHERNRVESCLGTRGRERGTWHMTKHGHGVYTCHFGFPGVGSRRVTGSTGKSSKGEMANRVDELTQTVNHLWGRVERVEDRVDRLYAQNRVFTMQSKSLESGWEGLGAEANAGKLAESSAQAWVKEVAEQLGFTYPLPTDQPARDEEMYGRPKRMVLSALWALHEEVMDRNVVRIEPEFKWHQDPQQRERKKECFTLVFRHGESGNRVEKYVSGTLNHVLTQRNRESPGVLAWRAKTRAEKRA